MKEKESQVSKMRKLHQDIIKEIEKRSSLREKDLQELDIEEIEKKIKVKIANPRKTPILFEWELGERLGWQFRDLKFISEKEYKKREQYVNSSMKKM